MFLQSSSSDILQNINDGLPDELLFDIGESGSGNTTGGNAAGGAQGGGVPSAPQPQPQPSVQSGPGGGGPGVRPAGPNGNMMPNGDMGGNIVVTSSQMGVPQQPPQQQQQGIQQLRPPQPGQVVSMAGNPNINLVNALTTGGGPNKMQGQPGMPNGPMMSVGMPVSSGDMNTVTTINNGNIMQQRPMGNMAMNPMMQPNQQQQQQGGPMMQKQQIMMPNRPPIMMQPFQQRPMVNARMPSVRMQAPQNVMVSTGPAQQFIGGNPVINTSAAGGTMVQQRMAAQPNATVMSQQVQPAQQQQPGPVNLPPRYPANKMENVVQINQQPNMSGPGQQQTQQQQQLNQQPAGE